jgi:hypothetical protein
MLKEKTRGTKAPGVNREKGFVLEIYTKIIIFD